MPADTLLILTYLLGEGRTCPPAPESAGVRIMPRLLPVVLALIVAHPAGGSIDTADVVGVSDGDTLTVLRDGTKVRIRLHGIDAPETGQECGLPARRLATSLALGLAVTLRVHDTDRYGRTVADVILPDGRSLGRELVGAGMAWWYRAYAPADGEPARLEAEARFARRGLWSQDDPVPPWAWRKAAAGPPTTAVVGNGRRRVYHKPTCRAATTISEKNRVAFASAEQAGAAGYRRAGDCR
jgi:endonuclease YncB( thermonuclease family)